MNPQMLERIRSGGFAKVTITYETEFSGWIGSDPEQIEILRMDGCILNEQGLLEQISIHLQPEDITSIHFLNEAPEWFDHEGQSYRMEPGFHK